MPPPFLVRPCLILAVASPWLMAGCASDIALSDRDCMTRVMYFESNRSSPEGMLAVGTTVMNRLDSPKFPKTICGVIGQPHQFASGVLDKPMNPREVRLAAEVADRVLAGTRHPQLGSEAMFFHTAGLTFPYTNMHYVLVAGGNAFYEKRSGPPREAPVAEETPSEPERLPVEAVARAADESPPDAAEPPREGEPPPDDE